MTALIVIAKAPAPGRVKTRLCPPCTPLQAAELAAAALEDTLAAACASQARRTVLVLDGDPDDYRGRPGLEVIAQRGRGLDERLACAFDDVGPALLVGMDTPQITVGLLDRGLEALRSGARAVLGRTPDGGYWSIGLADPDRRLLVGVPMSTRHTAAAQLGRLRAHRRDPVALPPLRDVDTIADARAVARLAPRTRFAAALRTVRTAA